MRTFIVQAGLIALLLATLCAIADSAQAGPFRNRRGMQSDYYVDNYYTADSCCCGSGGYYPSGGMVGYGSQMYYSSPYRAYGPNTNGPTTSFYTPPYQGGIGSVPNAMPRETMKVRFVDGNIEPATMTIPVGTTVRWINDGKQPQTVTSVNGDWDSGDILPGKEFAATFNQPGTFEYTSRFQKSLKATITVK